MNEDIKKIFDILGVEPNEEFKIREMSNFIYIITENLKLQVREHYKADFRDSTYSILSLIREKCKIIKMPKFTDLEQQTIELYKALGAKWMARDSSGTIYFFDSKPVKKQYAWDNHEMPMFAIFSFEKTKFVSISWADTEPYYIGD